MDSKIWYTEENFWYTEENTSYVTLGKLCYMDSKNLIHGGKIFWYTEEKYKLCYIRKALFTWTAKIWYTEENFWYTEEKYKLCYIRKALLHGQQNLIHGRKTSESSVTRRKFSDTQRKHTSYVTLGKLCYMDKTNGHTENFWYTEEKYKLCYIRKALLHGRTKSDTRRKISDTRRKNTSYVTLGKLCLHGQQNLIHGGKFLIHGGKIQVMLH